MVIIYLNIKTVSIRRHIETVAFDDCGSQVTLLDQECGSGGNGVKGKEGGRRKEMDGRIVMCVVPTMYILHQLGHTYLYIFRGIVLHRRSL